MSDHLAIKAERQSYKPGEQIAGTVEVLDEVKAKELTVVLEYREITADYRVVGRAVAAPAPLRVGDVRPGETFPFSFELPADALPNQSGKMAATTWGLHARIARFGPDVHAWLPLTV
jgi:hypothetical protein